MANTFPASLTIRLLNIGLFINSSNEEDKFKSSFKKYLILLSVFNKGTLGCCSNGASSIDRALVTSGSAPSFSWRFEIFSKNL